MSLEPQRDPHDEKLLPLVGWITYIVGMGLVGLVIAYVDRGNARSPVRENYTYMIRTFWIGLVYALVAMVASVAIVLHGPDGVSPSPESFDAAKITLQSAFPRSMLGIFALQGVILVLYLWFLARCIKGLVTLVRQIPIRRPKTWLV